MINNPEIAQRVPLVAETVGTLDRSIVTLWDRIDSLKDRLSPVMRSNHDAKIMKESKESVGILVPLADELIVLRGKVDKSISDIEDILDRLEV